MFNVLKIIAILFMIPFLMGVCSDRKVLADENRTLRDVEVKLLDYSMETYKNGSACFKDTKVSVRNNSSMGLMKLVVTFIETLVYFQPFTEGQVLVLCHYFHLHRFLTGESFRIKITDIFLNLKSGGKSFSF